MIGKRKVLEAMIDKYNQLQKAKEESDERLVYLGSELRLEKKKNRILQEQVSSQLEAIRVEHQARKKEILDFFNQGIEDIEELANRVKYQAEYISDVIEGKRKILSEVESK